MSEAPVITPLTPLGEFITKLGRPAGKTALHTYLMRLREQGWDVSQTVRKALHCGASLEKEVFAHHNGGHYVKHCLLDTALCQTVIILK